MIAGPQRRALGASFPVHPPYTFVVDNYFRTDLFGRKTAPCSRSHSRHRVFTVQSIFVYRTKRHCLCSQTYESLCSVSLLPYHSRSPTLHISPLFPSSSCSSSFPLRPSPGSCTSSQVYFHSLRGPLLGLPAAVHKNGQTPIRRSASVSLA